MELILNSIVSATIFMLWLLKILLIISLFVPMTMGREGFFPMVKELVNPLFEIFGKVILGPLMLSPIIIFTVINIWIYALSR